MLASIPMSLSTRARRLTARIAALAMALAALAPAITHALAAAHGEHHRWVEVCTATGARMLPVPTDAEGAPIAPNAHPIDHCPYCSPGASPDALPASPAAAMPAGIASQFVPSAFLHAPRPQHAWLAARPRAPPAAS